MRSYPPSGPVRLHSLLADNASTTSLKSGAVQDPMLSFDFAPITPVFDGFKPMVREGRFDFGELAIVTYLQARALGKPVVMLPAVIGARFQHHCICYDSTRGTVAPADLARRRVAVRSYTQTTGVWVRGILQQDYGVDPASVTWVCFEDSHLAEFQDPPNVIRAPEGATPLSLLLSGQVDAALLGSDMPDDPRLRPLIDNPKQAATAWHARTGIIPMNHVAVVHQDLVHARPDIVARIYQLLCDSRARDLGADVKMRPFGLEAMRPSLEAAIRFSHQQGVIATPLEVEALFEEATRFTHDFAAGRAA